MFRFSMDVMFDLDSIVDLDSSIEILAKCSKCIVLALMGFFVQAILHNTKSEGKGHCTKVKGRRAKIIVWGTSTGHGKYAVMVWCQSCI